MGGTAAEPRRLLLILHGQRANDELIKDAIGKLKEQGHKITVRVTFQRGDVNEFVQEAVARQSEHSWPHTIVAGGGDGTLNEVVNALLKIDAPKELSVAQLPLGTANDLASAAGISLDPYEALGLALDPTKARPIDVALVNDEAFMNIATVGPISEVSSAHMPDALKKALGPAAMVVDGLYKVLVHGVKPKQGVVITYPLSKDMPAPTHPAATATSSGSTCTSPPVASAEEIAEAMTEDVDGTDSTSPADAHAVGGSKQQHTPKLQGDLLGLVAGNARQMGRMVNICPNALLDDGLIDFTVLFGTPGKAVHKLLHYFVKGDGEAARDALQFMRMPWLLVESSSALKTNRDGEPTPDSPRVLFEVLPRRIRMHLPDDRLLVSGLPPEQRAEMLQVLPPERATVRRRLLLEFLKAQQPPGRLRRALPTLRRHLRRAATAAALVMAGYGAGYGAAHTLCP